MAIDQAAGPTPSGGTSGATGQILRSVPELSVADGELGIVGRLRDVVTAQPDAVAVTDLEREVTFRELADEAAPVLAAIREAIQALGGATVRTVPGAPGGLDPVGVLHAHEVGAVAAILGVVCSGHPVLVLDPRTPEARLRQFVDQAGVRVIVCDAASEATASALGERAIVLNRDATAGRAETLWADPPDVHSPATLGFTSGSTGRPKLVAISHRTVVMESYSESVASDGFRRDDAMAHTLPMAFAAGIAVTIAGVLAGTTMRLYDARTHGIATLPGWVESQRITVMYSSPAILRALLGAKPTAVQFRTLRSVMIAGEASYPKDIEPLRALLPPGCTLHNWYGSSEGGMICDHALTAQDPPLQGALPAGRPAFDSRVELIDDDGNPVPDGQSGVVTVTAVNHMFMGYWLDPVATAGALTLNPDGSRTYRTSDVGRFDPDGVLHLMGRRDHSVKIRGYLVDPAEVDAALFTLPEVREAVVIGAPRETGGSMRLIAYVVPAADQPSAAALRAALRALLPAHMVPETIIYLTTIPRTDRGKIDRSALPPAPPRPGAATHEVPLTRWEEMVADIWREVLELDQVGRHEDFFELGGDSLAAEALITRVITELAVPDDIASTTLLIQAPTIAEFAARLRRTPTLTHRRLIPLQPTGTRPPLFILAGGGGLGIAFVPWARLLGPDQPSWAIQSPALEGRALPDRSVPAIARSNITAIRTIQPTGPYHLAGHSFGGVVAIEMAHQLHAAGQDVDLLAIIDSFPPDPTAQPPLPHRTPIQKLRDLTGLTLMALRSTPGGRQHWRFQNHAGRLAARYTCPPWNGPTLVLVADSEHTTLRSQWTPHLTGTWTLINVPGDHLSITRLPWATTIADHLTTALNHAHHTRHPTPPTTTPPN